jgi:hypothetical protein
MRQGTIRLFPPLIADVLQRRKIMKKWNIVALLVFMSFVFVGISSADLVSITVTGTADTTGMGYSSGSSYSFTWVLADTYTGSTYDHFSSSHNHWYVQTFGAPALWDSVYGDGLSGTYVRPSPWLEDYLSILSKPELDLISMASGVPTSDGAHIGLAVNGIKVKSVKAAELAIDEFSFPELFINPADYMRSYLGTYVPTDGFVRIKDINGNSIKFSATSVEVVTDSATTNGTPHSWLADLGYNANWESADLEDLDNDGFLNWQEFTADTNPTNDSDYLHIGMSNGIIKFDSSLLCLYSISYCDDLQTKDWQLQTNNISGSGSIISISPSHAVPARYYRVNAERAEN